MEAVDADRAVLARWFQFLATKGVEELAFVNRPSPYAGLRLPAALFSCASLRCLYLGAWRFVDTATLPRGASFPRLQELVLGAIALEDRDLNFLLAASPVLEVLTIVGSVEKLHACLTSHSLRCAQFCLVLVLKKWRSWIANPLSAALSGGALASVTELRLATRRS